MFVCGFYCFGFTFPKFRGAGWDQLGIHFTMIPSYFPPSCRVSGQIPVPSYFPRGLVWDDKDF